MPPCSNTEHLLTLARTKKLYNSRYWHILLHYKKTFSKTKSLIDDPAFFLSPHGKTDPKAEIEAAITTFFSTDADASASAICRFYARYTWLKKALGVNESIFPVVTCEKTDDIHPKSATLVFPTYYMNNPASMFGHTLLIIETGYKNKRLSQAVNYAARVDDTNSLVFTIKGIFGMYKGFYTIMPYYKKIKQYNDINQRDIWEYKLNLTEAELKKMVAHLVELENIYADYYFFNENCSFNLLYLLEAARPQTHLTDKFIFSVMPVETIRLAKEQGFIESVAYRPSTATKIKHAITRLDKTLVKTAFDISMQKKPPETVLDMDISSTEKIQTIDLAVNAIQYQYAKDKISQTDYSRQLVNTLNIRSTLGQTDSTTDHVPKPLQPEKGHKPKRLSIGAGNHEDGFFQQIEFRPAFTDLLDNDFFKTQGLHIEFFDTRMRYYPSDHRLKLDHMDIIDIVSLSSIDMFFKPLSWQLSTGFTQTLMSDGKDAMIWRIRSGAGLARYHDAIGLFYTFATPELNIGNRLEHDAAAGMGFEAGVLKQILSFWKCHLYAKQVYFELGERHRFSEVTLSQNFRTGQNGSVRFDLTWEKAFGFEQTEAVVRLCAFF
jgi:hypothetical protein